MQRNFNFTGMNPYPVQDFAVTENQRGPIADRSRETLVSSDRYLIHVRRRLMQLARQLQAGEEPQEPWHPEAYAGIRNFRVLEPGGAATPGAGARPATHRRKLARAEPRAKQGECRGEVSAPYACGPSADSTRFAEETR